ncbi:type II toxin-antitoxin system VapC family toxin [Myxacorys almedinensis]|uniref:PIN domain-containing protein n=1 Tax=Myxacorys almedinensis A TaxID=2690445 RepID=A0A8J8CPT4_9CYAN|nr:PIN domain-containing protein [Myxacorys almedinensis]NDJ19982.1 PIN domain-containing protein [Myxacorys almedinensis A]
MKQVFADTFYWLALLNSRDEWHNTALKMVDTLEDVQIVTIDEVLVEVLNALSAYGTRMRQRTVETVKEFANEPNVLHIPQSRSTFANGLALYEQRLDKEYSLTDCISMQTMRQMGIVEVLTEDKHFTQEGFIILFRKELL